ncbi:MAG TPA: flagellar motor protein [Bryobacteraceae bacterium]|nr:flagellar motor protein [Bryobacteraceae bacterium]
MAETTPKAAPAAKPSPKAAAKPAPEAKPKVTTSKLDLATIGGIALALFGILGGLLLEKGSIQDIAQGTAAMIVLGGTFGAVLVTNPLAVVIRAFAGLKNILIEQTVSPDSTIETLIQYATKARKNGIVSLESEAASISDPFLRKALGMAVDGTDLQEIKKMMEIDINLSEQSAEAEAKVWESAGGYSPTIGIIGAVLGLIQVMKHLEDIKEVGHGIAVAFVATVYGVGSANILFLPAANKLRARMHQVTLLRDMTMEGVIGIVEGLNPTLIRMKLQSFNQHPQKPATAKAKGKAAPAPGGKPAPAPAGKPEKAPPAAGARS